MDNSVMIKGNKYGLVIYVEESLTFSDAKKKIVKKLKECEKFYKGAALGVTFEGKKFTDSEERELIYTISEKSAVNITCVIDNDEFREAIFKKSVEKKVNDIDSNTGQFYKGTLRSGQVLESESSVIILGDVNPGAKVMAAGNVVVLGSLKGTVYAGIAGNPGAFVVALEMNPVQIRIGNIMGRCADKPSKVKDVSTKIAYLDGENIYIEPLCKEVLNDIKF
ncbi:MAG: septum site-determining protein MinC [Lachnospiraceae bacterium]|nr:septum site-determining protein MinC [Lachnospiraceae bacterium]